MKIHIFIQIICLIFSRIGLGIGEEIRLSSSRNTGSNNATGENNIMPIVGNVANINVTTNTTYNNNSSLTTSSITKSNLDASDSIKQHINVGLQLTTSIPTFTQDLSDKNSLSTRESTVKQLGLDDLSEFIKSDSVVLFYVPWCVFCRGIMPEFEKAASMFKDKKIHFGKIDCNEHRKVVLLEQVMRFPTIKIYSEGQSQYFAGLPNAVSIVNFLNNEFNRDILISDLNVLNVFRNTDNNSIKVVAIVDHEEGNGMNSLSAVSSSYTRLSHKYHSIFFAHALRNNTEVINFIQSYSSNNKPKSTTTYNTVKENSLAIFTPWNDDNPDDKHGMVLIDKVDFNNFESLEKQVLKYQYPLITEFDPLFAQKLFSSERAISFLFINNDLPNLKDILERYRRIAMPLRGEILFVKSGTSLAFERRIAQVLINEDCPLPCISILKFPKKDEGKVITPNLPNMLPIKRVQPPLVYRSQFSGSNLLKDSNMEHFFEDFVSGRLHPYFKSEEPPSEEDNDGPVRIVVSKTFKKEVLESDLDVLIVFYAPWCGHCRKLEPDYNALAQRLRGINDKLKIAKIDGSQNEVDNIQILGYPSILLFKSGKKTDPIMYNGDRSVANMIKWISENTSFKFDHLQYLNPELAFEDDDLDMALSHEL
ncbi:protein disulfide isomerase [Cryptosporidium canis]|uniref:protein disulfide-isomerase n=1 Tax=Cryptosporidium canis TaxID=195482 RepID=A0A9D5HXU8_9CRYT|nr:protein disulfide isomerase [Cryptosporidium canis]